MSEASYSSHSRSRDVRHRQVLQAGDPPNKQKIQSRGDQGGGWVILFLALFKFVGGADSRALLFLSDCCRVEHHAVKKGSGEIP